MENEKIPQTDFGDGGVGSQKQPFVGTDRGILPDEQVLPDDNPTASRDGEPTERLDPESRVEGEPNAGEASDTRLTDSLRHSGLSGNEASLG